VTWTAETSRLVGDAVEKIGAAFSFSHGHAAPSLGIERLQYLERRTERSVVERTIVERESVTSERREDELRKTAGQPRWRVYGPSAKDLGA